MENLSVKITYSRSIGIGSLWIATLEGTDSEIKSAGVEGFPMGQSTKSAEDARQNLLDLCRSQGSN